MSYRTVLTRQPRAAVALSALVALGVSFSLSAADRAANLSAPQIVEKNVAARGGLQAWRAVQSLSVTGKMDAGSGDSAARSEKIAREGLGASAKRVHAAALAADSAAADKQVLLPFALEMKRPGKSRLEIQFAGKTAVQVYDGKNGWKLRPYLNREDAEPFTADEAKSESTKGALDGPLVDYAAKGTAVALDGVEKVDGKNAYKLKLTMKNGDVQHIWIDAQSFLDVKVEGVPRRFDGKTRNVWVYQRDFRTVQGLKVPFLYVTAIEGGTQTHKMTVESVMVNPSIADARFDKPQPVAPARSAGLPPAPAPVVASK